MKKILFALVGVTLILTIPAFALAENFDPFSISPPSSASGTLLPIPGPSNGDIWTLLGKALQWLFNIVIFLAAIFLVVAGFQYVTSNGDDKKVQTAFKTLIYALIGVAVAVLAKSLIAIIGHFLGTTLVS